MVPSTVSRRKAITYPLATVVFFQCLLSMPGACPSCCAARAWNGASSGIASAVDGATSITGRLAGVEIAGGSSGDRSCTCFYRTLRVLCGPLRLHEDVTAPYATGVQTLSGP